MNPDALRAEAEKILRVIRGLGDSMCSVGGGAFGSCRTARDPDLCAACERHKAKVDAIIAFAQQHAERIKMQGCIRCHELTLRFIPSNSQYDDDAVVCDSCGLATVHSIVESEDIPYVEMCARLQMQVHRAEYIERVKKRARLEGRIEELALAQQPFRFTDAGDRMWKRLQDLHAELAALARGETQAPDLYYIQHKGYCGNSLFWWRPNDGGYTSNLDEAWKVSKEKAEEICRVRRGEDVAWLVATVDAGAERHAVQALERGDKEAG